MLSPLQERIARIIAGLSEAEDFAHAGVGARTARGDVNRKTIGEAFTQFTSYFVRAKGLEPPPPKGPGPKPGASANSATPA